MKKQDMDVAKKLAEQLDASLDRIERDDLDRLRNARLAALEHCRGGKRLSTLISVFPPYRLTPAKLSLAVVALLAVSLFTMIPSHSTRSLSADDLEIVTSKEQVAMIEDLDFYRWLAVAGDNRNPTAPR